MGGNETIKSYKGFNKDMTSGDMSYRGKQYKEGETYVGEQGEVEKYGIRACEYPLNCLAYYPPSESVYHEVEQSGEFDRWSCDTTVASTKIKIGAEIGIAELIKGAITYVGDRIWKRKKSYRPYKTSSITKEHGASFVYGYGGVSVATGKNGFALVGEGHGISCATGNDSVSLTTADGSIASATGDCGASSSEGYKGISSATGNFGGSSAEGDYGISCASGGLSISSASGYKGISSVTGDYGFSSISGNCGVSSVTGYRSASEAKDPGSIAVAWGYRGKARGVKGSYLVLADWRGGKKYYYIQDKWKFKGAKMVRVDGDTIKENVWYTMKKGKIVEAK